MAFPFFLIRNAQGVVDFRCMVETKVTLTTKDELYALLGAL